ncbi:MAG: type II toxin-antitoxin system VapC family toxin [Treponema sp.]
MIDSKIFIDTAPFIYALENNEQYTQKVQKAFINYYDSFTPLFTSFLTFTEYCVVPYKENNHQKIEDFENFISDAQIEIVTLTKEVAEYASFIRSKYQGIKAMDALQLASAIQNHCDIFLTNDKQLKQVKEITVLLVDEL